MPGRDRLCLGVAFYILAFISIGLYGIALLQVAGAKGLGWVFMTASGLVIALEVLAGGGIPLFVFSGTAALGAVTWRLDLTPEPRACFD